MGDINFEAVGMQIFTEALLSDIWAGDDELMQC